MNMNKRPAEPHCPKCGTNYPDVGGLTWPSPLKCGRCGEMIVGISVAPPEPPSLLEEIEKRLRLWATGNRNPTLAEETYQDARLLLAACRILAAHCDENIEDALQTAKEAGAVVKNKPGGWRVLLTLISDGHACAKGEMETDSETTAEAALAKFREILPCHVAVLAQIIPE